MKALNTCHSSLLTPTLSSKRRGGRKVEVLIQIERPVEFSIRRNRETT
jgi:hypothetical protein